MLLKVIFFLATIAVVFAGHKIEVVNRCGGRALLMYTGIPGGRPIDVNNGYYTDGDLRSFIIYRQGGSCGLNGENCITVEGSLFNTPDGRAQNSVNLSLVGSHKINNPASFTFAGATFKCSGRKDSATCKCGYGGAYCADGDGRSGAAIRSGYGNNQGLKITFC
ncbi:gamma-glutamyl phosphate reductase proA [Acrasis kona]|uniref:Gamma-glutamyl phosphate reductase proA n=1 Tax=Acrasis kona TaxID=1008807 RepID=A0AAW2YIW8_9EUKA